MTRLSPLNRVLPIAFLFLYAPLVVAAQANTSPPPAGQSLARVLLSFSRLRYEQLQYDLIVLQQRQVKVEEQRGSPGIQTEEQLRTEESKPSTGPNAKLRSNMLKRQRQLFDEGDAIAEETNEIQTEMSTLEHRIGELERLLRQ